MPSLAIKRNKPQRAVRAAKPARLETLLQATPAWAKPIVAAAIKLHLAQHR